MKKASVRDLHIHTSELVRDAEEGAVIIIERRGEPVAELRPLSRNKGKLQLPDMNHIWRTFPKLSGDSTRFVEEDRERCT
ncbi:MAG: type II toxin-antitoxin system prevent-host-death family antitoxin [Candidatus Solibacter sp.]